MSKASKSRKAGATLVDELSREAQALWTPPPAGKDAAEAAERALFAKIDAHEQLPRIGSSGRVADGRFWGPVAVLTAVAAAAMVFAHPHAEAPSAEADRAPTLASGVGGSEDVPRPTAPAELAAVTRDGRVTIDGAGVAAREGSLHDGQSVESKGGEAIFAAPGRVDWLLESGTEVGTTRAGTRGGAIVLALRVGAVEAQVVPVPQGEAFAVDVDGVRVAVHGTHLRVARPERGGTRVVVDLSEGVIAVGTPPKSGSTIGHEIVAPAHVEFSVTDVEGTLRIDKDPASVRPPVDPASLGRAVSLLAAFPPSSVAPPVSPATPISVTANAVPVSPAAAAARLPSALAPRPVPTPTESILSAAQSCVEANVAPGGAGEEKTIRSVLTITVNLDGSSVGHFDPPLEPALQSCVSGAVFATRWPEAGSHRIPIEIRR